MKEYLGKTCPYCKTEIKEGEDIIVCSDCGIPHHKECWIENHGCTTFGFLGTIQGVSQSTEQSAAEQSAIEIQPQEEKLGCFKCGTLNPFSNSFCRNCGARLLKPLGTISKPAADRAESPQIPVQANQRGTNLQIIGSLTPKSAAPVAPAQPQAFQQPNGNPVQNVSEEDFIKVNSDFYRKKFMEMRMENKKFTWNWAAWFFNVFWCFYRKMYMVGLIALGIQLIGLVLVEIEPILNLLTALGLGALGNSFYMRYTEEALIKAQNVPDLQRYTYLRRKGGTSVGAVFIVLGGLFFLGIIYGVIRQFLSYME